MHDIEPYYHWRHLYIASEDRNSPFYRRDYNEFHFTNAIYNFYIHPQWDGFGSATLYSKILYCDYEQGFAIIELIGEWNDAIYSDIISLRGGLTDKLEKKGINKFILIAENVLNYHAGEDNEYYEEWHENVSDKEGWIAIVNPLDHVADEMFRYGLQQSVFILSGYSWRGQKPNFLLDWVEQQIASPQQLNFG